MVFHGNMIILNLILDDCSWKSTTEKCLKGLLRLNPLMIWKSPLFYDILINKIVHMRIIFSVRGYHNVFIFLNIIAFRFIEIINM